MSKPILCVDFDGVVHSYSSGWKGADVIPDPPVPGALRWLFAATEHFDVQIYSSRSKDIKGIQAMRNYIRDESRKEFGPEHPMAIEEGRGVLPIEFAYEKPAAFLTIDDRAICFDGNWSTLDPAELIQFQPWNKRQPAPEETAVDRLLVALVDTVDRASSKEHFTRAEVMSAALYLVAETGLSDDPADTVALLRSEVYSAFENILAEWAAMKAPAH